MSNEVEIPKPARKPRATSKVAKTAPDAVVSVGIEEVVESTDNNVINPNPVSTTKRVPKSNNRSNSDGVVSSVAADIALQNFVITETVERVAVPEDKVALWSEKNARWDQVGSISKGYNIVTKEVADKWITLTGIRIATPEEIVTYYGK
jgi:hypothetical protein